MTRQRTPEFEAWLQRARDTDILEEALSRGAQLRRGGREHSGPCPLCGGTDRFSINTQKAMFNCRGATGGDVIAMVMHLEGLEFMQAVEEINGEPSPGRRAQEISQEEIERRKRWRERANAERERRRNEQEASQKDNQRRAGVIWRESGPITGTLAETYLRNRGILRPNTGWPDVFRFHKRLHYPTSGDYPALICRVDNAAGIGVGIWRIYLSPDGGKAPVTKAKLGLGPVAGGAVRIGGIAPHIGLAEGIESALGAWRLIGMRYPVWAGLSTSGVSGFQVPDGVDVVTSYPDGDKPIRRRGDGYIPSIPAGRSAVLKLAERLKDTRVAHTVAPEPPAGLDYLDLFNQAAEADAGHVAG